MKTIIAISFLLSGIAALNVPTVTGPTPPPVPCSNSMCAGKSDGNYNYDGVHGYKDNYFVQCVGGKAYCQACWPLSMKFKQQCNQCLYGLNDPCHTTQTWVPEVRYTCPDICPARGPDFKGNIRDSTEPRHYVGCWNGVTVGCVNCPKPLLFNEQENACLWEGKYLTKP
ncbi:uncharacterized protein LOC130612731 [Hydractinia symbiolongicarpus]|uniref:uncharacterized protein LOC130612731 n=1 Tax=Hydractinia symbiolongicarpus TaxID=13093 RepID=UPI00254BCBB3|nr:uncharacterized protein LOC130612731 [Hydractinia symbiolongicarpus]